MLQGLATLKAKGMTSAMLGVDDRNVTKAMILYEKVGFKVIKKDLTYEKRVEWLTTARAVFIGDSIKFDYEGAQRAGLKSLLIDRFGKAREAVETIWRLAEVLVQV